MPPSWLKPSRLREKVLLSVRPWMVISEPDVMPKPKKRFPVGALVLPIEKRTVELAPSAINGSDPVETAWKRAPGDVVPTPTEPVSRIEMRSDPPAQMPVALPVRLRISG